MKVFISTKKFPAIALLVMLGVQVSGAASPETQSESPDKIISTIEAESNGNITIDIPDDLIEKLLAPSESNKKQSNQGVKTGFNKSSGFRIQVFSDGRNQHTLESRAKARGGAIVAKFPKYRGQVYSYSSSPNWYTRVGNFRTAEEASSALAELKRAFPQFASEMRVVKSKIVVLK